MGDVYDKSQELNGSSFQRSLSLPPAQRKQRVTNFPFIEQNEQTVALSEKRETGSLFKSRFGNKSLNMFRISKKVCFVFISGLPSAWIIFSACNKFKQINCFLQC